MVRTKASVNSSFERLAAINRVITTSLNFTEALRLIVDNAAELFAADNSLLLLMEADGRLRVKAAYADSETTSQFSGPMEESVIRDLSRHLKLDPARELATAPIVVHGSITGFLAIVRESQLTTEEQWQLSALADQAAIALNNARLHEFQTGEVMRQRDESLAALHESNRKINKILESITDLYYQLDRQWRFTDINRQTAHRFRKSREELLGQVLWEVFPGAVESELYPQLHKALAEMVPVHFDFASNIVPGVWFEAHGYPSKAGLSVYLRDITERKGAELANNLLAAIVESSDDAIVSKDLNGIIQSWNNGAQRIFGYQPHEVIGKHITVLIPVDSHAEETEIMGRIRRGVRVDHYETIRIRKDGRPINVSLTISPVRNAQGQVIGASKIARDITESKKAQEQLKRTLDFDEAVMLSMGEGLYTVDTEGRTTFMNPAAQKLFGWNLDEVLGRSMHDVTHHTRPDGTPFPQEECAGFRVLHEGTMLSEFEDVFIRKDGTFFDVVYSSSPLRADGKITGLAVVFRDVSDRKHAEQERERLLKAEQVARAEAEKANRLKDEFLATLSHELRNPLNVVIGYSEILRRGNESQKHEFVVHAAETIRRNALAQSQLVSDLLDLSRLQMAKLSLDCQPVSLSTIMTDAMETVRAEAAAKSIALEVALDPEPVVVEGDPIRLAQIAWNLLNNAIKFTPPEGRVRVALDQEGDHARVTVEDSGQGIAPQFLPHVFEMFRQADASSARRQGGMGIGLALVQQLTKLHGGTVQAESEGPGQGARFTVCIPLYEQGESGLAQASPGATGALRRKFILVVDDSPETTEMLTKLLELEGALVESAASGAEALQIASKKRFDLIISDISMPEMDGYQLLSSLRKLPEMAAVPAVALTGYGRNADIERAKEEGFSEHLTKPLDIDRLLQVVRELTD